MLFGDDAAPWHPHGDVRVPTLLPCLLALALAQVPWMPCHCGDTCEIRPLLLASADTCHEPDHATSHRTCPAHGCTGHRSAHPVESAPSPDDGEDHHHEIYILQAVTAPPSPSLPAAGSGVLHVLAPTLDVACGEAAPRERLHAAGGAATGPPEGLASTRLLL